MLSNDYSNDIRMNMTKRAVSIYLTFIGAFADSRPRMVHRILSRTVKPDSGFL